MQWGWWPPYQTWPKNCMKHGTKSRASDLVQHKVIALDSKKKQVKTLNKILNPTSLNSKFTIPWVLTMALTHLSALPGPPSWFPGHMMKFTWMLPALLKRMNVVLELRDSWLPLTGINRTLEDVLLLFSASPSGEAIRRRNTMGAHFRTNVSLLLGGCFNEYTNTAFIVSIFFFWNHAWPCHKNSCHVLFILLPDINSLIVILFWFRSIEKVETWVWIGSKQSHALYSHC